MCMPVKQLAGLSVVSILPYDLCPVRAVCMAAMTMAASDDNDAQSLSLGTQSQTIFLYSSRQE